LIYYTSPSDFFSFSLGAAISSLASLVAFVGRFLEVFDSFSDTAPDFRQFACPKNNQDDNQNNDQFWHAYTKHCATSASKHLIFRHPNEGPFSLFDFLN